MQLTYDIVDLISLTRKSQGHALRPNEFIVNARLKDNELIVETRLFQERDPVVGDIVCMHDRDYVYIDGFTGGKYRAVQLTKGGHSRDNRTSYRYLSIDNTNMMKILKRGIPRDKFSTDSIR